MDSTRVGCGVGAGNCRQPSQISLFTVCKFQNKNSRRTFDIKSTSRPLYMPTGWATLRNFTLWFRPSTLEVLPLRRVPSPGSGRMQRGEREEQQRRRSRRRREDTSFPTLPSVPDQLRKNRPPFQRGGCQCQTGTRKSQLPDQGMFLILICFTRMMQVQSHQSPPLHSLDRG